MSELAVVAGATGSVGSALVGRLLARGMGVVAVARNQGDLEGVEWCATDLSHNDSIDAIQEAVAGRAVRMAVIAVGLPVRGSVETIDPDLLAVGTNLKVGGTVRLLRAVSEHMGEGSRFVSFAGTLGLEPGANEAGPGVINAALFNLMKQIALNYGPRGVTVHTVAPGPLDSPRLRRIARAVADERGVPFEEVWAEYESRNSLGRLPTIDEVAWAVEMLLAPEAAAMHGSVLHLDAGGLRGLA